jgi:hypothetical protein
MITLELLVSLGSSFAAFGVARLYSQSRYKILSPFGSLVSLDCKIILTGSSASVAPCDMIKQTDDQINS